MGHFSLCLSLKNRQNCRRLGAFQHLGTDRRLASVGVQQLGQQDDVVEVFDLSGDLMLILRTLVLLQMGGPFGRQGGEDLLVHGDVGVVLGDFGSTGLQRRDLNIGHDFSLCKS